MMHEVSTHLVAGWWRPPVDFISTCSDSIPIVVHGTPPRKRGVDSRAGRRKEQAASRSRSPMRGSTPPHIKTFAEKVPGGYLVQRPEGVDLDRPGRQQDHAAHAHHPLRGREVAHGRHQHFLHRPRPLQDRGPQDPQDGPQGRRLRTPSSLTACRARGATGSARKARGSATSSHSLNPERILVATEAIGIGDALRRADQICRASAWCSTGRSGRTRASSIPSRSAGWIWSWPT